MVEGNFLRATTNQKDDPDLGGEASSVWKFCVRFSDAISRGNQWWRRDMSAVFSGLILSKFYKKNNDNSLLLNDTLVNFNLSINVMMDLIMFTIKNLCDTI